MGVIYLLYHPNQGCFTHHDIRIVAERTHLCHAVTFHRIRLLSRDRLSEYYQIAAQREARRILNSLIQKWTTPYTFWQTRK